MLPTEFLNRRYKLTEVNYSEREIEHADLFGDLPGPLHRMTVLEDGDGNVIREWCQRPSLTDIFEELKGRQFG